MPSSRPVLAALIAALAAAPAFAAAPSQVPPNVEERPRPDYDPKGLRLGDFVFFPRLSMSSQYSDNIYAASSDAVSDLIWRVQPDLRFAALWPNDKLELSAFGGITRYTDHSSENTDTYGVSSAGMFSIHDSTSVSGNIDLRHEALPRESILSSPGTLHPVEYNQGSAHVELTHTLGNLQLTGFGDWLRLAYQNNIAPDGSSVFEKDRNFQTLSEGVRGDYAIGVDTSVFVSGRLFTTDYQQTPPAVVYDRSSNGYEVTGGIRIHETDVLSGDIGAGYLKAHYPHIGGQDVGTLALHVALAWYPTLLTTVKLRIGRAVEQAPMEISSGYLVTRYRLEVDHELRRNVVLSMAVNHDSGSFGGTDRHDSEWSAGASATYLLNPSMNLKLSYTYQSRDSVGADRGPGFRSNNIMLTFVLQR